MDCRFHRCRFHGCSFHGCRFHAAKMSALNKTRCVILVLAAIGRPHPARAQDVVLVVNNGARISQIKTADLRAIFVGAKTRFPDGSRAIPVTLKGGPAHEVFLKHYVGEGPTEFRSRWQKVAFTGQGTMPKVFDSEADVIEFVANTPGALGYVSRIAGQDRVKAIVVVK